MIGVVVVNFRATEVTLECLASLDRHAGAPFRLMLVDNGAASGSDPRLVAFVDQGANATLLSNRENLGFAQACNQAIALLLADPAIHAVALLNNDAVIQADWLAIMERHLAPDERVDMVAAHMLQYDPPHAIDSLGITFYKSGIASNRKTLEQPLLGPCGGAALYSRRLLQDLETRHGYVFDPTFFCYAEDTDLALRARSLGYACDFAAEAQVLHRGSHTTGGGYNTFIAYHGLRNSLFALFKNLPARFLLSHLGWILLMQAAVILKYLVKGQPGLIWRIYRDVARGLPEVLRDRRRLASQPDWRATAWRTWTSRHFYDRDYLREGIRTLARRDLKPPADRDLEHTA